MDYTEKSNIGEVVAHNYKTAAVFKTNKIDFCCNGNRTISEAAIKQNLDISLLLDELGKATNSRSDDGIDFNSWPVDLLADYIQKIHHSYVVEKLPIIVQFLEKLSKVHGENHPELHKIYALFVGASTDLVQHMKKEELVLFPYARQRANEKLDRKPTLSDVVIPVKVMMQEHENEGDRFREIRELTNDYTLPSDACRTYQVAYAMLEEFEADLHKHIHLENNILFPKLVK